MEEEEEEEEEYGGGSNGVLVIWCCLEEVTVSTAWAGDGTASCTGSRKIVDSEVAVNWNVYCGHDPALSKR